MLRTLSHIIICTGLFCFALASCTGSKEITDTKNESELNTPFRNTYHDALQMKIIERYDTAAVLFEKCLVLEPTSHASHAALSTIYESMGDFGSAFSHGEIAHTLAPKNRYYTKRLALLNYQRGAFNKSIAYFEEIIEDEENVEVKFTFTDALMKSKKYERAIEIINELETELGASPQFTLTKYEMLMQLAQPEEADMEIVKLLENNPSDIDYHRTVADFYVNSDETEKAKAILKRMREIDPTSGLAYMVSSEINLRANKFDAAFEDLFVAFRCKGINPSEKAGYLKQLIGFAFAPTNPDAPLFKTGLTKLFIEIDSTHETNAEINTEYGHFLMQMGDAEKASGVLQKAVKEDPSIFENWKDLAILQYDSWQFTESSKTAINAINYFPSQPFFYLIKGQSEIKIGNLKSAHEYTSLGRNLVVKNDRLSADFEIVLGIIEYKRGDYKKALEYYEIARKKDDNYIKPYVEEAFLFAKQKKFSEAYSLLNDGLSKFPNNPDALDAYGTIYFNQAKYKEAAAKYEKALTNKIYNATVLEHYGDALFMLGRENDAVDIWKESRKQKNYSPLLHKKIEERKYYAE